ncbi:ABC transporter substrate-binding protein [Paenibacillus gansuensis]|uniref:ABC transporter substrate-binding protein n=1 Tax=Paenibacillus gansuensis TaxID=306542 RepID=A0ABW5P9S8_9BACL
MSKWKLIGLSLILSLSVLSGCGNNGNNGGNNQAGEGGSSGGNGGGKTKTIKLFNFKVEIAEALDRMKADYEKEHPGIKLQIESMGGGQDYGAGLKAKVASGDIPDIFFNGGFSERDTWLEYLEDLSDQPWVNDVLDVAKEPMTKDGKLYGLPMNLEGYGFVYNKDLFNEAGITEPPHTLTELKAAAEKLKAKGITPFANGYQEWWVLGNHNVNVPFAHQPDPDQFIGQLNSGQAKIKGNEKFNQWLDLLDVTLKYSNKNPLTTDYNSQVTMFASGQAAMMQQGNWTQVQIDQINPELNLGVLPMPINDDPAENDKLLVGVPNNWVVHKNSKVKQEAKDFLNWLVTSESGKRYIVEEFKFIPALKSIEVKNPDVLGDLATNISQYSSEGKTLSWNWFKFPEGAPNEFAANIQAYISGKRTRDQLLDDLNKTWNNLKK